MTFPVAYYEGVRAKDDNCPYGEGQKRLRCWWFAGRADAQMKGSRND